MICQAQAAPVLRTAGTGPAAAAGGADGFSDYGKVPTGSLQPPRRGQVKRKIVMDIVAAVASFCWIDRGRGGA
jgi:hypothetical protein